ncbi:MAG: AhpC/TSA family protein [Prevotella sp.]|nr:AhpC/TSA family protein [Prevotella sp.]
MKRFMMKATVFALVAVAFSSCSKEKFHITGTISNAKDSVLYIENLSLDGPVAKDSVKLNEKGNFEFADNRAEAPEFYRLRIANQIINISVDSTETIHVEASYPGMATNYKVEGSKNCDVIKELALRQIDLQNRAIAIQQDNTLSYEAANDSITSIVNAYKEDIKRNYIFKEPMKAYAYFALFQTLGNRLIFNPREIKDDVKVFAAVATSWDTYYPEALRGKNLHNIAIEGMKNIRIVENKQNQVIDASKVNVTNIIDINLLDNKGVMRNLTDLKGKVVLLDFHVFATKESPARIMKLRDIYNKYHAQGLEIYQVSLDPDEHFWKQQTAALPWVSVRDPQGVESQLMISYNIQGIPTYFLLDRTNTLYKRDAQMKDLEAEIKSLL